MNWKNLFTPVRNMSPTEAKAFMDARTGDEYQLVDVRQPREYEDSHLPDAIHIPLAELPGRMGDLDRNKAVIAYCAIGGRSRGASQLLSANGFTEVYNLAGGIKAWRNPRAAGPVDAGLELLHADVEFSDALTLAYAMEDGLQRFYETLAADRPAEEQKLFKRLAGFEQKHKDRLQEKYMSGPETGAEPKPADIMEGGAGIDSFLDAVRPRLRSTTDILDLAMNLETQAFDLYGRLARHSELPDIRKLFRELADEEKSHLAFLAAEMDKFV